MPTILSVASKYIQKETREYPEPILTLEEKRNHLKNLLRQLTSDQKQLDVIDTLGEKEITEMRNDKIRLVRLKRA